MRIEELRGLRRSIHAFRLDARLFCRSYLREILSIALVLACIWTAPFGHAQGIQGELRVALQDKPERVYDPQRDACTPNDIPDVNARAFRAADGTVTLTALHFVNRALRGPDLDHVKIDCKVILNSAQSSDPTEYDGRRFITALWSDDGEHVAALVHNEYHAEHFAGRCTFKEDLACWYNTILSFRSDDAAHRFAKSKPVVIAAAPFRQDAEQGRHRGFFNPSNIFAYNAYKYAFVATTGWDRQPYGACLFRNDNPLNSAGWRAFDGRSFSVHYEDPYAGQAIAPSACAPIAPFGFPVGAVVRHRRSGIFIAIWEAPQNDSDRPVGGFYTAFSRNLIDWSAPRLLLSGKTMMGAVCAADGTGRDGSVIAYPSMLDAKAEGRNFDNIGDEAWLYYTAIKLDGCVPGARRVLLRQKIGVDWLVKPAGKERRS